MTPLNASAARLAGAMLLVGALATGCAPAPEFSNVATDLWVVTLDPATGEVIGGPERLTDREGYDNQPSFLPDGSGILYSSGVGTEVDIWRHDFAGGSRQLTHTPEREYSPQVIPGEDGFSAVRTEDWGDQRLWRFDADGGTPMVLLEWEDEVGYYTWVDRGLVALTVVDDDSPAELRFADIDRGWVEPEATSVEVGRSLHHAPGRNSISYIQDPETDPRIVELDLLTRYPDDLIALPPGASDFAWGPDGTIWLGVGVRLMRHRPGIDEGWVVVASYDDAGLTSISRIAVSPNGDRLILVAEPRDGGSAGAPDS